MITPIETVYRGYRFRSRLEARWAVFFDSLGIEWQYEPEGFMVGVGDKVMYLPDFYFPKTKTWVEVKGEFTVDVMRLLILASDWDEGLPYLNESVGTNSGILILGNIPDVKEFYGDVQIAHPIVQHHEGVLVGESKFTKDGFFVTGVSNAQPADAYSMSGLQECFDFVANRISGKYRYLGQTMDGFTHAAYATAKMSRFEHGESKDYRSKA